MIFEELEKIVADTKIYEKKAKFPIKHIGGGLFQFENESQSFSITKEAAGRLQWRVKNKSTRFNYKTFTKAIRAREFDSFEIYANEAIKVVDPGYDNFYILRIFNDKIVGILRYYEEVPHIEILKLIEESKLKDNVINFTLDHEGLTIDLEVETDVPEIEDSLEIPKIICRIRNGHSGLYKLENKLAVMINNKHIFIPKEKEIFGHKVKSAKRHLSNIGEMFDEIVDLMEQFKQIKIRDLLDKHKPNSIIKILDKYAKDFNQKEFDFYRLIEKAFQGDSESHAAEVLNFISAYDETHGFKAIVNRFLEIIFKDL